MRKNLLLVLAVFIFLMLGINSFRKIVAFKGTSTLVEKEEQKLEQLKQENEKLKNELAYKKSDRFQEEEIRNKLGLAKEGEEVVVVPGNDDQKTEISLERQLSNWKKWKNLIFGT